MSSFPMICFFRVPGAGLSRHASDIRKIYEGQSFYKGNGKWWGNYQINDLVVFNDFKVCDYQLPQRLRLLDCFPYVIESKGYMKFTSYIILITSSYDCYISYGNGTELNKRRLDLHIIKLESYVGQIIKGYGYERDKKYIEPNTGDLNVVILHFRVNRNLLSV